jgi:hypothetical protein
MPVWETVYDYIVDPSFWMVVANGYALAMAGQFITFAGTSAQ